MKAFSAVLLVLCLVASSFAIPKQVIKTTHRIEMRNGEERDICSSTAIGKHALLTATHCDLGALFVTVDDKEAAILERLTDSNDHTIYIVNLTFKNYAEFATENAKLGDEVWIRGNPDGLPQLLRHGYFAGTILVQFVENALPVPVRMYDLNGWNGDNGSAMFNKHGQIVDVLSVGYSDGGFDMAGCFAMHFPITIERIRSWAAQLKKAGY